MVTLITRSDDVCDRPIGKFLKEFKNKHWGRIKSTATKVLVERNNKNSDIFDKEKSNRFVTVLNSNKLYHIEVEMDDHTRHFLGMSLQGKLRTYSGLLFTAFNKTRINNNEQIILIFRTLRCSINAGRKIEKLFICWGQEIFYVTHRDKLKSSKKVSI